MMITVEMTKDISFNVEAIANIMRENDWTFEEALEYWEFKNLMGLNEYLADYISTEQHDALKQEAIKCYEQLMGVTEKEYIVECHYPQEITITATSKDEALKKLLAKFPTIIWDSIRPA